MIELNQVCATQTGCAEGDDPGFPITLTATGSYRLTLGTGGRVRDSIADNNGGTGMILGSGGVATGSIASTNVGDGIRFDGTGGVASGNSLVGNGGSGLIFTHGGVANGNTVYTNHWDGITVVGGAAVVVENSAGENHQLGIFGGGSSGLNALGQNTAGGFSNFGIPIACNVVDGVRTCP
ncbi:MAG: hypothetical protein U0900_15005 [Myxococcota bacterium]